MTQGYAISGLVFHVDHVSVTYSQIPEDFRGRTGVPLILAREATIPTNSNLLLDEVDAVQAAIEALLRAWEDEFGRADVWVPPEGDPVEALYEGVEPEPDVSPWDNPDEREGVEEAARRLYGGDDG